MTSEGKLWGYLEGYYWKLLTWDERELIAQALAEMGANCYLYAPKEDPLHRREWRTPYGKKWLADWKGFVTATSKRHINAIPAVAPGLSFDYLSPTDYKTLLRKFEVFRESGCSLLALLMDDIPPTLPKPCLGVFKTLGEAHGKLLTRLLLDLNKNGKKCRLWFCPTVYTDQFTSGKVSEDPYLLDLAATMPEEITLMWTGPGIISEKFTEQNLRPISKLFKGNTILWDNFYANDYCPQKLFVGPYLGRPQALWNMTQGIMLNPTGMPLTDIFLLQLLAANKQGEVAKKAWSRLLKSYKVPLHFPKIAQFLNSPFYKVVPTELKPAAVEKYRKVLHPLIWDWVSSLHREWAPYLFMLDADLKACLTGKNAPEASWVRKRYSPILAKLLLKN